MKTEPTFTARIALGLKEGYDGKQNQIGDLLHLCRSYCDTVHLCVSVTPTHFVYVDGEEEGAFVELINYPRFPSSPEEITTQAIGLAMLLKQRYKQERVSVICPDRTYLVEDD